MKTHHWLIGIMLVWLSVLGGSLAAQTAPTAFVKGLELINSNAAEAKTQHGVLARPVPVFFCVQPIEQRLIAFEQLLERVEKQALAKAPRAREEEVFPLRYQLQRQRRFIDVVMPVLTDFTQGLDADGEFFA